MRIPGTPRTRAALVATASTALILSPAAAHARAVDDTKLAPHSHFVMQPDGSTGLTAKGEQIPNIDSVKSTIRTYYNATSGIADKDSSPYITEMKAMEADMLSQMPDAPLPNLAVVFDADDTTLWTYDMEDGAMHFNFDPKVQNDDWVVPGKFPATPGMVDFVKAVEDKGYNVFGITGRGEAQEDATLANLEKVGYTEFDADNFYTKFASADTKPAYLDCSTSADPADDPAKCTTVEYKAGTRKHIEDDLGMKIVLNIGDQFSDLQGGYAMNSVKLPNPTYYLPSPNIKGAPASDADLTPRTEFTMAPDGSSGATEGGEGIPNIDSVKSTIRTYYGAVNGIANKTESPYISEMKAFSTKWSHKLRNKCANGVRKGIKPAVVFDADETTLWGYDMEDGAMHFNFDPTLQDTVGQGGALPGRPGHGEGRPVRRQGRLPDRRPHRSRWRPAASDHRQPREVLLRQQRRPAVQVRLLLHQGTGQRPVVQVVRRPHGRRQGRRTRRSTTRPRPASTSRTTSGSTSSPTSVTSSAT